MSRASEGGGAWGEGSRAACASVKVLVPENPAVTLAVAARRAIGANGTVWRSSWKECRRVCNPSQRAAGGVC
eukprot:33491-Chlamydomonas_euryale.AAC.1